MTQDFLQLRNPFFDELSKLQKWFLCPQVVNFITGTDVNSSLKVVLINETRKRVSRQDIFLLLIIYQGRRKDCKSEG